MINLNELAKEVTEAEGQKISLSVAQVKEVIRITLLKLSVHSDADVIQLLNKRRSRSRHYVFLRSAPRK